LTKFLAAILNLVDIILCRSIKVSIRTTVGFERVTASGIQTTQGYFRSQPITIADVSEFDINLLAPEFEAAVDNFNRRGSGWVMRAIDEMVISYTPWRPLQGSSFIKTPDYIAKKRATVNIDNKDSNCFLYSILAGLRIDDQKHSNAVEQYKRRLGEINYAGLEMPMKVTDVGKFEKLNPDISVNVFYFWDADERDGGKQFCPLHVTENRNRKHHVNLLLLESEGKTHYILIKSMSLHSDKEYVTPDCRQNKT